MAVLMNVRHLAVACLAAAHVLTFLPRSPGAEPFRFPEGTHQQARLTYINALPVLTLAGAPEEMGEQLAALTAKPSKPLMQFPQRMLNRQGLGAFWPLVTSAAEVMVKHAPEDHRRELNAGLRHADFPRDALMVANSLIELRRMGGCSTLYVDAGRSKTGGPLLGRNLDLDPMGVLHKYSLLVIAKPEGKFAFASVTFPGLVGVLSGMNEHGLALATLDVYSSRDGSKVFDPEGVPLAFCFRRVLEQCKTVDEAAAMLRQMKRTTWMNLAVCDTRRGAVLEITPKNVVVRLPVDGLEPCTNHFRSPELATFTQCRRYSALEAARGMKTLGVEDVARLLHRANQGPWTLQTMIFEPTRLKLRLAIGAGPTSAKALRELDLAKLFKAPTPARGAAK